jgi:hypothetical protein
VCEPGISVIVVMEMGVIPRFEKMMLQNILL